MSSEAITKNDLNEILAQIGYSPQKLYAITISTSDWDNNEATMTVPGVTTSNAILVSPTPASSAAYMDAGVICSSQGTNSLTFTCDSVPSSSVTVNVLIL